jgi:hypothetical protein
MIQAVIRGLATTMLLAAVVSPPAAAQTTGQPGARPSDPSTALGGTPGSYMHALLQRTILRVDVLTVELCFDEPTGRRFAAIAARGRITGAAADSITALALAGTRAIGRVEFLRDIPLRDFIEGVDDDLRNAVDAGLVPDSVYRALSEGLPVWYAPLQRRGIRKGDILMYEMGREWVRTVFHSREGPALLDRTETGRARRNSPLATWLAPGSPFRTGLLRSLQRAGTGAAAGQSAGPARPPCSVRAG